jgi:hydroxyethylthiazole kinase-like uncharacterized protein yjeF
LTPTHRRGYNSPMSDKHHLPENLILTREQVRRCDQVAVEKFDICSLVLMENAGSAAARHILSLLDETSNKQVCIVAGTGNNAGDGFVVARHLNNHHVEVETIVCGEKDRITGDALSNLRIIERMDLPVCYMAQGQEKSMSRRIKQSAQRSALIVDALLGTGAAGSPRDPIRTAIETINSLNIPVVSLDIPSGLDCDSGLPLETAIRAHHTITFAALKKGFSTPGAADYTGSVTVAFIGINTHRLI